MNDILKNMNRCYTIFSDILIINAALVSIRDFFQKILKNLTDPNFWTNVFWLQKHTKASFNTNQNISNTQTALFNTLIMLAIWG